MAPEGILIMFFLPHLYDTHSYMQEVSDALLDECYNATMKQNGNSEEFEGSENVVMQVQMVSRPMDVKEGLELYLRLVTAVEALR